jgi:hypothetical protein
VGAAVLVVTSLRFSLTGVHELTGSDAWADTAAPAGGPWVARSTTNCRDSDPRRGSESTVALGASDVSSRELRLRCTCASRHESQAG